MNNTPWNLDLLRQAATQITKRVQEEAAKNPPPTTPVQPKTYFYERRVH